MLLNPVGIALLLVLVCICVVGAYNYSRQQYGPAILCGIALFVLCATIGILGISL